MIYFVEEGKKIGAAQYNTYQSEDGKCFILDFWMFPGFRGSGTGHRCFHALEEYTRSDGAVYYEINCERGCVPFLAGQRVCLEWGRRVRNDADDKTPAVM